MTDQLLRIAIPNKGSLSASASEILREAGYRQRSDSKELTLLDHRQRRGVLLPASRATSRCTSARAPSTSASPAATCCSTRAPRPRSPSSSASGAPGSGSPPVPATLTSLDDLAGKRIATSYVGVVRRHLEERGIEAEVIRLDGAVESSIQLGVADVIADVVETGSTMKAAGLEIAGDVILESEAVLITRAGTPDPEGFEVFKRRLDGVLVARTYVMMDYDMPEERVEEAVALTPGLEGPTMSPLHREGWVAVRAMVPRDGAQKLMDDLYEIGARAILLTDIHACRL